MKLPPIEEWTFSSVPPAEVWACFVYECHREALRSDLSGSLGDQLRKAAADSASWPDLSVHFRRLLKSGTGADMRLPWGGLSEGLRVRLVGEFMSPPERPALEVSFDGIERFSTGQITRGKSGKMRTWEECREELTRRLRLVPFYLPMRLSRREMVARFDQWLRDNPGWVDPSKSGRTKRKWKPQEGLRYIAARRLVNACGSTQELASEAEANDAVSHELIQPGCAVPGEAEINRMIRKAHALVDAAAKGELRDFRMPSPIGIPKPDMQ